MFDRRNEFDRMIGGDQHIKLKSVPWKYNERKCVISFFAPRSIPDQTVRPFVCDFSIPFVTDLSDTIREAVRSHDSSYGGNGFLDSYMTNKPSSNGFLKPDTNGVLFKSKFLSECWTWICFLDNDRYRGHNGDRCGLTNRLIYSGFVANREEPVTSSFGRQIVNERAVLIPTHFTQLNIQAERGLTGESKLVIPAVDLDVVNPIATITNSAREFLLRPEDLAQSMGAYENNVENDWFTNTNSLEFGDEDPHDVWCSPEMCSLNNKPNNVLISSIDKSPKHQISKIVRGLGKTILGTEADRFTSYDTRMGRNTSFVDSFANIELFKNSVADRYPTNQIGLNVNEPIEFGGLLRKYPSLQDHINVYLFKFDPMEYCPDDRAITPINLYTAVLRSAIPPVMSHCGISDCSFFYATREPRKITTLFANDEPFYERLVGPYPFIEEDQSATDCRWYQVKRFLNETVFPMVEDGLQADIECVVHYHSSSDCGINLSIMGENVNNEFLVNNDILGGLTTPLVGTENNYHTNAQALRDVVNATTESKGF